MRPVRVLHISAGNLFGGVEVLMRTLARRARFSPDLHHEFAACFEGRLTEELRLAGAKVHVLGPVRARNPISVRSARARLRQLLDRGGFDAAICHMAWAQAIFGPVVRDAGIPLILWHHDPGDANRWLDRWARQSPPDLAICSSRFTAAKPNRFYPELRIEVLYCPVEPWPSCPADRIETRKELGLDEHGVAIVQAARMERWKGQLEHLEALSRLRDLPNWVCWQAGGPQRATEARYFESLKDATRRLGIAERVRFLGFRANMAGLLHAADIYCQPNSGPEGFGIALVEALWAGLPVVTTKLGPAAEIVDDSCGVLVPAGDTPALATALRALIEDPDKRARLAAAGPHRAKSLCDPRRQMERLAALLQSAFSSRTDSSRIPAAVSPLAPTA